MGNFARLKGFTDLYGADLAVFTQMESTARLVFGKYCYQEIRPPILESTALFQRGIGEETDVVQKEMFSFTDRKGRPLTMRPEATAGVLRAAIELGLARDGQIARLFTTGPMFRYERPQKGRQRQFHQINCECLGTASPYADAEIIVMLLQYLQALGLKELSLKLNSLGCKKCRPGYLAALKEFLASRSDWCADCQRRIQTNPLRVLDCKQCQPLLANAPDMKDHLCEECREHFQKVLALLDESGISWTPDTHLVRGLDYYTRTAFEVVSGNIGAQTAVAGGGRYDGLPAQLGGPDIPGIGFACGMERLALLMETPGAKLPDFYIVSMDETARNTAFLLAEKLRKAGYTGEMNYQSASMKSMMRQVSRSGTRFCIVIGPDELARGMVTVKNMETGAQKPVEMERVVEELATV